MASNLNVVALKGNLTRDAEAKNVNGKYVVNFSIAVNESVKGSDGKYSDYPNYVDCSYWTSSEKFSSFMTKGKGVSVEGKLHQDRWEKDGQKNSRLIVRVSNIDFMSLGSSEGSKPAGSTGNASDFPEDVPF